MLGLFAKTFIQTVGRFAHILQKLATMFPTNSTLFVLSSCGAYLLDGFVTCHKGFEILDQISIGLDLFSILYPAVNFKCHYLLNCNK